MNEQMFVVKCRHFTAEETQNVTNSMPNYSLSHYLKGTSEKMNYELMSNHSRHKCIWWLRVQLKMHGMHS